MWTDMILGNPGASPSTLSVGTGRLWAGTVFLVFLHPAHGGRRALEGSQTKGAERTDMPRKSNPVDDRSEEHTSELQSLMRISYAVFCLKKKKTRHENTIRVKVCMMNTTRSE